jgi:hypothetical protein
MSSQSEIIKINQKGLKKNKIELFLEMKNKAGLAVWLKWLSACLASVRS